MASISRSAKGTRCVQFTGPDGKRKTLRLGPVSHNTADKMRCLVETLLEAKSTGSAIYGDTLARVDALGDDVHKRFARVGLVAPREKPIDPAAGVTLGDFLNEYILGRTDIKSRTEINYRQAERNLVAYFGKHKLLADITPGDADDFRLWMLKRLGENTVRRHCGRAKQFFRAAVRKRLLRENPFADMKGVGVKGNPSRLYFVSREDAQKVLDACPDTEWQLIFALSRYGGLRCPSEHLGLKWSDIDWVANRFTVRSPKTEHHEGKDCRLVPIFPELRPYLEAAFDPEAEYVITRCRSTNANLRTQLERIIKAAGLTAWPKLFQNLRSTRETELAREHPIHVVCSWIGNSPTVASKHYLQVTDTDFERAMQVEKSDAESDASSDAKATQNPTQPTAAATRHDDTTNQKSARGQVLCLQSADDGASWPNDVVPPRGLEPLLPD